MQPARQQHVSRLAAEERDALARLHRDAHHGAARTVDAARQIDRDDRRAARVHRVDQCARLAFDRAIEPGAEQRIDDDARAFHRFGHGRLDRSLPELGGLRGVALQGRHVAQQQQAHRIAALREHACRHEAVAAIVARPSHDDAPACQADGVQQRPRPRARPSPSAPCRQRRRQSSAGRIRPSGRVSAARSSQRQRYPSRPEAGAAKTKGKQRTTALTTK